MNKRILIIEDDPVIAEGIADTLAFHGFAVTRAADGRSGLELALQQPFDLVLLDIMLPGIDGFDICLKIRESRPDLAVIMLTARGHESDKLLGFDRGADDYLTKPFSVKELMARIGAVLRRRGGTAGDAARGRVAVGNALVDFGSYTVSRGGEVFNLSPKECGILKLLVMHAGKVIGRDRIIDEVWGDEYDPIPRTVDNFILKLRSKIEDDPEKPLHLLTVHGAGYKLIP